MNEHLKEHLEPTAPNPQTGTITQEDWQEVQRKAAAIADSWDGQSADKALVRLAAENRLLINHYEALTGQLINVINNLIQLQIQTATGLNNIIEGKEATPVQLPDGVQNDTTKEG